MPVAQVVDEVLQAAVGPSTAADDQSVAPESDSGHRRSPSHGPVGARSCRRRAARRTCSAPVPQRSVSATTSRVTATAWVRLIWRRVGGRRHPGSSGTGTSRAPAPSAFATCTRPSVVTHAATPSETSAARTSRATCGAPRRRSRPVEGELTDLGPSRSPTVVPRDQTRSPVTHGRTAVARPSRRGTETSWPPARSVTWTVVHALRGALATADVHNSRPSPVNDGIQCAVRLFGPTGGGRSGAAGCPGASYSRTVRAPRCPRSDRSPRSAVRPRRLRGRWAARRGPGPRCCTDGWVHGSTRKPGNEVAATASFSVERPGRTGTAAAGSGVERCRGSVRRSPPATRDHGEGRAGGDERRTTTLAALGEVGDVGGVVRLGRRGGHRAPPSGRSGCGAWSLPPAHEQIVVRSPGRTRPGASPARAPSGTSRCPRSSRGRRRPRSPRGRRSGGARGTPAAAAAPGPGSGRAGRGRRCARSASTPARRRRPSRPAPRCCERLRFASITTLTTALRA